MHGTRDLISTLEVIGLVPCWWPLNGNGKLQSFEIKKWWECVVSAHLLLSILLAV